MGKLSMYGLSGSGKSCYIFGMAQALSQGVLLNNGKYLTVICPDPRQVVKLNKAYSMMSTGKWPDGNIESVDYSFNCRLAMDKLMNFVITDYRGGLLNTDDEDDFEDQRNLFDSFNGSNVLMFFIGADMVKAAMSGSNFESASNLAFMNTLYENYLDVSHNAKTPIMIVITKSDLLSESEKPVAKKYVYNFFRAFFGAGTNLTTAITMVTLGKNLSNYGGELEGELRIGPTEGNIQIPILFSLFCVISNEIEESIGKLQTAQGDYDSAQGALKREMGRSAFARFFNSNEASIKQQISSASNVIGTQKGKLSKLMDTLTFIKPLLLNGADLYINGIKQ